MPSKTIYQNGGSYFGEMIFGPGLEGEFVSRAGLRISPQVSESSKNLHAFQVRSSLNILSNFFLVFSFVGLSIIFFPLILTEINYRFFQKPQPEVRLHFSDILNSGKVQASYLAPNPEFSIVIPKISAQARVFPNVSPADKEEYLPILKKGVAHAKGTALPGQVGNIYLFAHSANIEVGTASYNAVFYGLKDLVEGDQIVIFFDSKVNFYRVTEKRIVPASDVSAFEPQDKEEVLVLQTCWPPGTTIDRLLVFAKKA